MHRESATSGAARLRRRVAIVTTASAFVLGVGLAAPTGAHNGHDGRFNAADREQSPQLLDPSAFACDGEYQQASHGLGWGIPG